MAKKISFGKREIGLILGVLVFLLVKALPLAGLSDAVVLTEGGQTCLALTLACVAWWALGVAQPAYVGGIYCVLLILFKVVPDAQGVGSLSATVSSTFSSWTKATMWLVIGAYLIAEAVKSSGLGERIAYAFLLRFVKNYKSLVISIFVLTFILSLLIPHPFPRAFLIMSVVSVICSAADYSDEDRGKLGFLVFAAAAPGSMFFLTGDSTLNPLVAQYSAESGGANPTFIQWFVYMSVPMLVALLATLALGLILFKPSKELVYDRAAVLAKQEALGKITVKEIRTLVWLVIAIVLWLSVSGDYIGWVTLLIGLCMALPILGGVLTPGSWATVPMNVLIFLTSAMAIGTVGGATGMNAWIADVVLPSAVPSNIYVLALLIGVVSVIIHMFMGSVMAVLGVCVPAFIAFTAGSNVSALAVAMMVFSAINIHYILPFHNLAVLVGAGKENGGYSDKEAMRMGIPLTAVVFVVLLVEAFWFHLMGLM